ncbi:MULTISPECIES: glycosyltransferase family 2 protein [unclassified Uliginosibacterium]|jgi:glycosyltransferase involved in cell wall biosynthesis|uniref:glycosyltransferase family 2 protein n=1 Tax=unclassified Uliginosibacterium TaxID=2621521 RepID=UPI000C7A67AA|nr:MULTISPECIES: glycosyltransferase family 2 protein [unclassified Uliginosibacterium]MDO6384819.1 glycosyltransferase family 2 protein [Uliginosibacterium sp. 31-12]PLK48504.1 glycosyltransferase [Uliginosibacterium sp. TH139]
MSTPTIGLVIPCYNEEEVLRETTRRLIPLLASMRQEGLVSEASAIFYVDDGSRDKTWALIQELSAAHPEVCGIKLSRNRGHQNALFCGLMTAPGDALISVDADLQDDLDVIPQMVRHYREGCEIVYGVRKRRDTDTFFKRFTAEGYYKLMAAMKVDIVFNHADYRLLSRRALDSLSEYREVNLFLRGMVRLLGYQSATVEYDRAERFAGESKYPLSKMLSFAWQGITSFSTYPLRLITSIGILISIVSLALAGWGLVIRLFTDEALPGWASTVIPMYFLGGVQLLSLGVIGEYVAKIYTEAKNRPRFQVDRLEGCAFKSRKDT